MNHTPEFTLLHGAFPHYIWAGLVMRLVQYNVTKIPVLGIKDKTRHFHCLAVLRSHDAQASLLEDERPCGEGG